MEDRLIRIAIDAMGGDNAPGVLVEGSVAAVEAYSDVEITLVGSDAIVSSALTSTLDSVKTSGQSRCDLSSLERRIRVVHADDVVQMGDSPARAIRTRKNSSIVIANKLCKSGEVDAVISAGNTGAAMASSLLYMGRLAGVLRPAILAIFPSKTNIVSVVDVGANTDCKPEHLYQFGVMASIFSTHILGYDNPRVALLNIGEERGKGNDLTNAAYSLFESSGLNFIGNIEGRDIFEGKSDVIVCDGFVGNVLLKFGESAFGFVAHNVRKKVENSFFRKIGALLLKPAFREIKRDMSPDDYGGAPLLGVDGISIICHGNASPVAIRNAVKVARRLVLDNMNGQIKMEFSKKSGGKQE